MRIISAPGFMGGHSAVFTERSKQRLEETVAVCGHCHDNCLCSTSSMCFLHASNHVLEQLQTGILVSSFHLSLGSGPHPPLNAHSSGSAYTCLRTVHFRSFFSAASPLTISSTLFFAANSPLTTSSILKLEYTLIYHSTCCLPNSEALGKPFSAVGGVEEQWKLRRQGRLSSLWIG